MAAYTRLSFETEDRPVAVRPRKVRDGSQRARGTSPEPAGERCISQAGGSVESTSDHERAHGPEFDWQPFVEAVRRSQECRHGGPRHVVSGRYLRSGDVVRFALSAERPRRPIKRKTPVRNGRQTGILISRSASASPHLAAMNTRSKDANSDREPTQPRSAGER
jgi:hypothetical protein